MKVSKWKEVTMAEAETEVIKEIWRTGRRFHLACNKATNDLHGINVPCQLQYQLGSSERPMLDHLDLKHTNRL